MIRIVTDGTACLSYSLATQMGVRVVPVTYSVAGRLYHESYLDNSGEAERLIAENPGKCLTSHPPVAVFADVFRNLMKDGGEVLCLVISSRLSGTFSSATIASRDVDTDRIAVVDSLTTAGGLTLLLKYARTLIDQGLTLDEVVRDVEAKRGEIGIAFSVNDMSSLRKSGRLGDVRQSVGNVLNVRPILTLVEGAIMDQGVSRGDTQTVKALLDHVPAGAKEIVVHHLGDKYDPAAVMHLLCERFPDAQVTSWPLGSTLRIHLGSGFIVIAWRTE
jgi:DegV family protein with EDD domain